MGNDAKHTPVAAAPELLEALHKALDILRIISERDGDSAFWNVDGEGFEAYCAIRIAIAKAEGQRP